MASYADRGRDAAMAKRAPKPPKPPRTRVGNSPLRGQNAGSRSKPPPRVGNSPVRGQNAGSAPRPSPRPAAPRPSAPRPSAPRPTSVGTSSTGRIGSTGGGFSGGPAPISEPIAAPPVEVPAPAPPPPPPPSASEWLAQDSGFKDQENAMRKALQDFTARFNLDKSNYDTEYTAKTKELEKDRGFSLERLMEDYASRGLVRSGLYNQADTDLDSKFNNMKNEFGRAKTQFESNLDADKSQFETDNNLGLQRAKTEALGRRAARFGLV